MIPINASKPNTLAIIPARGGSKGIPRKNIQDVEGIPLLAYTIIAAQNASSVTTVLVNSEDAEIRETAVQFGARTMSRPEEYFHDNTFQEVDRLLIWTVQEFEKSNEPVDIILLCYPTSPLRDSKYIDATARKVSEEGFDSALTLVEDSSYLWKVNSDNTASPQNYDPKKRGPRQKELWNQWIENKAVYAMKRNLLMETGCRLGGKIGYVIMPEIDSIDVDTPTDLEIVRQIMKLRKRTHKE